MAGLIAPYGQARSTDHERSSSGIPAARSASSPDLEIQTSITFLGAAQTVTGSKYLLETVTSEGARRCGLFQGLKELRERNWQNLPIAAKDIDAIVLTHAHLDHCGYLPRLVARLPRPHLLHRRHQGPLRHRPARLRPDPGRGCRAGQPARLQQARACAPALYRGRREHALTLLQPVGYERPMPVADGIEVDFINAGHLLGSAYARVRTGGKRSCSAAISAASTVRSCRIRRRSRADYLLIESTYGNRVHEEMTMGRSWRVSIRETANAAAGSSFRRSRSVASRSSSIG